MYFQRNHPRHKFVYSVGDFYFTGVLMLYFSSLYQDEYIR